MSDKETKRFRVLYIVMPEAGNPCPNPQCNERNITFAGPLCRECLKNHFTQKEIEVLLMGPSVKINNDYNHEDMEVLHAELQYRVEDIKTKSTDKTLLSEY